MNILSLDLSSSCSGCVVWSDNTPICYRALITKNKIKFETLHDKVIYQRDNILKLISDYDVDKVYIENPLKKFTPGRSSANTIFTLFSLNYSIQLAIYEKMKIQPEMILPSEFKKHLGIKRGDDKKKITLEYVRDKYKSYPYKENRNNNPHFSCYDIADAVVVGEIGILKTTSSL